MSGLEIVMIQGMIKVLLDAGYKWLTRPDGTQVDLEELRTKGTGEKLAAFGVSEADIEKALAG